MKYSGLKTGGRWDAIEIIWIMAKSLYSVLSLEFNGSSEIQIYYRH